MFQGGQQTRGGDYRGNATANDFTVDVPLSVAVVAELKMGDTLKRVRCPDDPVLTIQTVQRVPDQNVWRITATADMRSPQ